MAKIAILESPLSDCWLLTALKFVLAFVAWLVSGSFSTFLTGFAWALLFSSLAFISLTKSGKSSTNFSFRRFSAPESLASLCRTAFGVSIEPYVVASSTINERSPVRIVPADHAGFQVSGWKSDIERLNFIWNQGRKHLHRPYSLVYLKSSVGSEHQNRWGFKGEVSGKL